MATRDSFAEAGAFGSLLKQCRQRLSPNTRALGICVRAPVRIGKAVTQEEVAEAAGISRVWYAMMENNRAARVSARVLDELVTVLGLEPHEHAALFRLALPETRSASCSERTAGMLAAFAWVMELIDGDGDVRVARALELIRERSARLSALYITEHALQMRPRSDVNGDYTDMAVSSSYH